jgi:RNA polymerase subunit RPABC4/transcription elongation factor Spt4
MGIMSHYSRRSEMNPIDFELVGDEVCHGQHSFIEKGARICPRHGLEMYVINGMVWFGIPVVTQENIDRNEANLQEKLEKLKPNIEAVIRDFEEDDGKEEKFDPEWETKPLSDIPVRTQYERVGWELGAVKTPNGVEHIVLFSRSEIG